MDKIVCFGKNYSDHIAEMGDKPVEKPVIFLKPASVLATCDEWAGSIDIKLIPNQKTHYECELVLKLKTGGYRMNSQEALASIDAYTIGLDMTLREVQQELKDNGHPWTIAKVFPNAAIIGPWIEWDAIAALETNFSFSLNKTIKQQSVGRNMLFSPAKLIEYASQYFPLCAGDILFTGTPSGVGMVEKNMHGRLTLGELYYGVNFT